jgi:PAS domain-containing protein
MSHWVWKDSIHLFSDDFIRAHERSAEIVAAFDTHLYYVFVNEAACKQLNSEPQSLLGKNIIELYPQMIASRNHRNLLRALDGKTIRDLIDGPAGQCFESIYTPVLKNGKVSYVIVKAKRVV